MTPKPTKRRWYLRPILMLLIVGGVGFSTWFVFGNGGLWSSYHLRSEKLAQAEKIRQLELKEKKLAEYLSALRAGNELAMERAARDHGLVATNETIYDIKVDAAKP
jgi:cell division protein FtsB